MNKPISICTFLWCALAGLAASSTEAAPVTFVVDPLQSSLTLSGSFQGFPFSQQSAGSLIDAYAGLINGDLVGSTVTFTGGSAVAAQLHPNGALFTPAGVGVTNYGVAIAAIPGQIGAYRDVILDLINGTATNGVAGGQSLAFSSGHLDYDGPATGPGSLVLVGVPAVNSSAGLVSLSTAGLVQTLRIPVTLNMSDNQGLIQTLDGMIVATRAVPEPSTAVLFAVGCAVVVAIRRSRR